MSCLCPSRLFTDLAVMTNKPLLSFKLTSANCVKYYLRVAALSLPAIGPKQTCRKTQSMSLLGVKRTSLFAAHMSAYDPKRTFGWNRTGCSERNPPKGGGLKLSSYME